MPTFQGLAHLDRCYNDVLLGDSLLKAIQRPALSWGSDGAGVGV